MNVKAPIKDADPNNTSGFVMGKAYALTKPRCKSSGAIAGRWASNGPPGLQHPWITFPLGSGEIVRQCTLSLEATRW